MNEDTLAPNDDGLRAVEQYVQVLERQRPLSKEVREAMSRSAYRSRIGFIPDSLSAVYGLDDQTFRLALTQSSNDLLINAVAALELFAHYIKTGFVPPPYYVQRLAIVLRRHRYHSSEKRLLAAWCAHFSDPETLQSGSVYAKLVARALKVGAFSLDIGVTRNNKPGVFETSHLLAFSCAECGTEKIRIEENPDDPEEVSCPECGILHPRLSVIRNIGHFIATHGGSQK